MQLEKQVHNQLMGDFFVAVPMQPGQSLKDYLIATARRNDPHYVHQMVHKAHASATEKKNAKIIKGLKEVVQALKAKVAELEKDNADEIGEMQELVKRAQAAAEAAASSSFALDPNLLEKRNGVTCPSTEKMASTSPAPPKSPPGRLPRATMTTPDARSRRGSGTSRAVPPQGGRAQARRRHCLTFRPN